MKTPSSSVKTRKFWSWKYRYFNEISSKLGLGTRTLKRQLVKLGYDTPVRGLLSPETQIRFIKLLLPGLKLFGKDTRKFKHLKKYKVDKRQKPPKVVKSRKD